MQNANVVYRNVKTLECICTFAKPVRFIIDQITRINLSAVYIILYSNLVRLVLGELVRKEET